MASTRRTARTQDMLDILRKQIDIFARHDDISHRMDIRAGSLAYSHKQASRILQDHAE